MELVLFKKLPNIKLSRSVFRVTMFFQFGCTKSSLNILLQYTKNLEENIQTLYTKLVTNYNNQKIYEASHWNLTYLSLLIFNGTWFMYPSLTSCSEELSNYRSQMLMLYMQLYNMSNTSAQSKHSHTKCAIIHSLFNFLFGTSSSTEEINAIKYNMEILKGNQYTLSNQIKQTFNCHFNLSRIVK